jgi:hypothetical protein
MTLNELAAGLVKNGILVLCVSEGNVTDFLISASTPRTVIFQSDSGLSSYVLDESDRIVNVDTLMDVLKVSKE